MRPSLRGEGGDPENILYRGALCPSLARSTLYGHSVLCSYIRPRSIPFQYIAGKPYAFSAYIL